MRLNSWTRQVHRWIAIAFTLMVLANITINITGLGGETVALWVGLSTLVPLLLLMLTGLYLFALPYTLKGRGGQTGGEKA